MTSNLRTKKMTMILKNLETSEAPLDPLIHLMTKKEKFAKCTYKKFKAIITNW